MFVSICAYNLECFVVGHKFPLSEQLAIGFRIIVCPGEGVK